MIILSGVLVVLAIALLVAGIVAGADGVGGVEGLTLIYISIGISVVSALCLAIGVFLRRRELFGPVGAVVSAKPKAPKVKTPRKAPQPAAVAAGAEAPGGGDTVVMALPETGAAETWAAAAASPADVPGDATVYVVPGRKRYHLETCRQLAGRDKEELTYAEAQEEGFTSCTACMPDTALAARAAVSAAGPETLETESEETESEPAAGSDEGSEPESVAEQSAWSLDEPAEPEPEREDPLGGGFSTAWEGEIPRPAETPSWLDEPESEPDAVAAEESPGVARTVRILSGTKRYHRPDCALIEDIGEEADDLETLDRDEAKERGCTPCLVCQPDKDSAEL